MSTQGSKQRQYLPPQYADVCAKCRQRVFFKFVASRIQAEGRFRIVYLRCPSCGARASRLVEIVAPYD
jgi:RNase P subunit RPR2